MFGLQILVLNNPLGDNENIGLKILVPNNSLGGDNRGIKNQTF